MMKLPDKMLRIKRGLVVSFYAGKLEKYPFIYLKKITFLFIEYMMSKPYQLY